MKQVWKCPFDGFILNEKNEYQAIDQKYILCLGDSTLFLEVERDNKISGHLVISFDNDKPSFDIADSIRNERFEYFSAILKLKNLKLKLKWGQIKPIFPYKGPFEMTARFQVTGDVITPHALKLTDDEINFLQEKFVNLETHQFKNFLKSIILLANLETSKPMERFFYQWISFNTLYGLISRNNQDRAGIENFATILPNNSELSTLLSTHSNTITKLTQANLINLQGENFSQLLTQAQVNNQSREIWKYTLLCIYQIRNDLFHRGIEYSDIYSVNKLLKEIINFGFLYFV